MKNQNPKSAIAVVAFGYFARYLYLAIVIPLYGRTLGPTQYGVVLSAMSLFSIVWLCTNYGYSIVGTRDIAQLSDASAINAEFGSQLHARMITGLAGICIGIAGTFISSVLRNHPVFGVLATFQGLLMAFNLGWYFQGRGEFKVMTLIDSCGFIISLGLILLLVRSPPDAIYVLVSLIISAALTTLAAYVVALRSISVRARDFRGGVALIRRATPAFLAGALPTIVDSGANYLLSVRRDAREVGNFGAAERMSSIVLAMTGPVSQVISPTVAHRLSVRERTGDAFRLMRHAVYMMLGFGIVATLGTVTLAPFFVPLVMGPKFTESIRFLQFYSMIFPLAAFNGACRYFVFIPLKRDRLTATIAICNAATSISFIFILLGYFGGLGIIAARILSELIFSIVIVTVILRDREMRQVLVLPARPHAGLTDHDLSP